VVGDRGYSSHGFREHIWTTGARPAIPTKRNEEQLACPDWVYNNRNIVERLWGAPQGVARRRHTLREDRRQLRRCPLPRRNARLAQVTTGPSSAQQLGGFAMQLKSAQRGNHKAGHQARLCHS
ncbi:transposase, partial [Methylorubrum extorquens]|uniref:transposase n=1 Tax=Methylorubrum extorquens TaxID=408 RepID=UPI003CC90D9C